MGTTCTLSRARILIGIPATLLLALVGAGCRNESERAEGAIRDTAEEVREQAGRVKKETRELGSDIRELQERNREAWIAAGKAGDYQVEMNPDGSVVASKTTPPAGNPPPDDALKQAVNSKLATSSQPDLKNVNATVQNGVVTLRGSVASIREAQMAVSEVLDTEGVTRVVSHIVYGT